MSYSILYSHNGVTRNISDFVSNIQYGGDNQTAVRKLDVSILSGTDAYIPKLDIRNGGMLTLFSEDKEIIRAIIFKQDRDDKGSINISGYTHGIYLTKNKDTQIFKQLKANQIAKLICNNFNIPIGTIVDTEIILDKLILRDKSLWDMLLIALTETTKQSGIKYRVFFKEGKLNIVEKRKQYVSWVLEKGANLLSASSSKSIEEMKNQIKVTGKLGEDAGKDELVCVVKNDEMQKLYGILQETKDESGDNLNKSKLRQIAETMLKELCKEEIEVNIEALGIDGVEAGMAVYVVESVTGITGSYYVEQDDHTIQSGSHSMSLKLTKTDEVPQLEYEASDD